MSNKHTHDRPGDVLRVLDSKEVETEYQYSLFGYFSMFLGATAVPKEVDVYTKKDHKLVRVIKDKKELDELTF